MGWDYSHEDIRRPRVDLAIAQISYDEPGKQCEVVYAAKEGSTVYAAARVTNKENGISNVIGIVVLTRIASEDYFNFGTKVIGESMGPCESRAPKKLIDMLSPTDDESALAWRERCLAYHRQYRELSALGYGSVIALNSTAETLVVYHHGGKRMFKFTDRWVRMPIPAIIQAGYHVVSNAGNEEVQPGNAG